MFLVQGNVTILKEEILMGKTISGEMLTEKGNG